MDSHLTDIARVIQLAVAPVFLLTAIATLITALNNRLGRIVDRRRVMQDRACSLATDQAEGARAELGVLARRARLIYLAILFAVLGALLICLVVAGAFIGALVSVDLARGVAGLFILSMLALVACLSLFLREVYLAVTGGSHMVR